MNVFNLRDQLVADYSEHVRSYIAIQDARISKHVAQRLDEGMLWPEPLIQLNPSFEPGAWIDELVQEGVLNALSAEVLQVVGTSATLAGDGTFDQQRREVACVANRLFGRRISGPEGAELLDAHKQVRVHRGVSHRLETKLPPDILGLYLHLP